MKTYTVEQVAAWFLSKDAMSPKKLQKLVYYAYAWFLTLNNDLEAESVFPNVLFDRAGNNGENDIKAWIHGPVIPHLWRKYKEHGFWEIEKGTENLDGEFDAETLDILNQVWDVYGGYNANELESLTHQEAPWINARKGLSPVEPGTRSISDEDIFTYYIGQAVES